MSKLIKKILLVYISIVLTFAPSSVFAASAGGWAFIKYDLITGLLTAFKNGVPTSVKFTPPTPNMVTVLKGASAVAIAYAVAKYGGQAIDWVMGPDNTDVRRNIGADNYSCKSYVANGITYSTIGGVCATHNETYSGAAKLINTASMTYYVTCKTASGSNDVWSVNGQNCTRGQQIVSLEELVPGIIDGAKKGDAAAVDVVNQAIKDAVNQGIADTALDNAKLDKDAQNQCGNGTSWNGSACVADTPTTPDTPFDPTDIIDAIGKVFDAVMSLPDVINNALDWFKSDPDPQKDNKPDIDDTQPTKSAQDFDSNYINFGGQCPSFSPTTISVGIVAVPISFNAQPLCDFAILCRPIILALAYFAAMAIVANAIRSE